MSPKLLHNTATFTDHFGTSQFKIEPMLTSMAASSEQVESDSENTQAYVSNKKTIRLVVDDDALNDNFNAVLNALCAPEHQDTTNKILFTITELCFCPLLFEKNTSRTLLHTNLQKIIAHSDMLICNQVVLPLLAYADAKTSINNLINTEGLSELLSALELDSLLINSTSETQWFYVSNRHIANFSYTAVDLLQYTQKGLLSAAIASFSIIGKRSCDAVVLALSALTESIANMPKSLTFNDLTWPKDLIHYPVMNTSINQIKCPAFATTETLSLGLYPVVDSLEWLERLLNLGIKTIQLRIKDTPFPQLDLVVKKAALLGANFNARLFINDYWQLAIKHQCYGVHLGQEDLDNTDLAAIQQAGLRLGVSTHSEFEWLRAISIKPSYIAMGTVYPTNTKPAILIGLNNLHNWSRTLAKHFPLVAIGGIKLDNIIPVLNTGVGSVAVVSAITHADNYKQATALLNQCQQLQFRSD